jgi:hypothetical protein
MNDTFEYEWSDASQSYIIWRVTPSLLPNVPPTYTLMGYVAKYADILLFANGAKVRRY